MGTTVTNYSRSAHHRRRSMVYIVLMADSQSVSVKFPVMPTYVGLAICFAVLAVLLDSTSAEHHKKKIIVKVPHVFKHIHHDHYKPIHIHKVRHKKTEHHYRKHEGKHKSHGSYSHLQPVVAHHDEEGQMNYGEHRQAMEYNQRQHHGLEYEQGRGYGQHGGWRTEDTHDDWKYRGRPEDSAESEDYWRPHDEGYDGEDWRSSEEIPHFREGREHVEGRENGRNKGIPIIIRPNHNDYENDDGWRPMMDFSNWKDESDRNNNYKNPSDLYNYSGEQYFGGGNEENYSQEETTQKKKKKQKRNKKKTWNKQIEVREPINEETQPHQYPQVNHVQHQNQPINPVVDTSVTQSSQWPPVAPIKHQQNPWPTLPQSQKLQWPAPQPTAATPWQTNSLTKPQPTQMVWTGHHLQLPSQTMWQVQQHSVKAPVSVPSSVPRPVLPPQPVLPLQPVLLPQPSLVVHQRAAPEWPMTQRTQPQGQPVVKQPVNQWQQSVSTSGRDGPAASYKVEVINYANPKSSSA